MDWGKFIVQILIELGGISGLTIAIVKFSASFFADTFFKRYEFILTKKLEKYKNDLDNKSYVSKAKFDANFEVFRELSEAVINGFKIIELIDLSDESKIKSFNVNDAKQTIESFKKCLYKSMPIISKEIYDWLEEMLEVFNKQIQGYNTIFIQNQIDDKFTLDEIETIKQFEEDTKNKLRNYYNSIEIYI